MVAAAARRSRRAHRRQHGPAASVHARRAAAILEIEGETVTEARCGIGYLHTGIEKNLEYRNWTQGVTFVTRMDYLSPFFNETAYCLGVEKLLDVTDDDPRAGQRHPGDADGAQPHLVAPGGAGHRRHGTGRDDAPCSSASGSANRSSSVFETDHRAADEPRLHPAGRAGGRSARRRRAAGSAICSDLLPERLRDLENLLNENYIWKARTQGIGYLDLTGCMALGITGPVLRSTGLPHDLRRAATVLRLRELRIRRDHRRRL